MSHQILGREKGFTILEVVFAVSILAIGILGYTSLKVSNRYSWVFAKDLTQAVPFTTAQLEGLMLNGYESPGLGGTNLDRELPHDETITAEQYAIDSGGDVLGVGDLPVGGAGWANWRGVNASSDSEGTLVNFSPSEITWRVHGECPTELTRMVRFTTRWGSAGSREMGITQIRVRP